MVNQESLSHGEPLEIERKFLIEYPDTSVLEEMGCRKVEIYQTYLTVGLHMIRRVRRMTEGEEVTFWYTEKMDISETTRIERENEITKDDYVELLKEADPNCQPIKKTRYYVYANDLCFEVDIFNEWDDKAIAEVELNDENSVVVFPDYLKEIREVTRDKRYGNAGLAKNGFFFEEISF